MKKVTDNKPSRLCVTVVGSSSVGKTALTVRYLTGRFIGEYISGVDMTYRHSIPSVATSVDILDISRPPVQGELAKLVECHDATSAAAGKINAYLVVYSLINPRSFVQAQEILARLPLNAPKYLVANQLDLLHRRKVSKAEGQAVADRYGCPFDEFSAAESAESQGQERTIKTAFNLLIHQLVSNSPYPRFAAFQSKLIGAFVSKTRQAKINKLRRGYSQDSGSIEKFAHSVSSGSVDSSSRRGISTSVSMATITSEFKGMRISSPLEKHYDKGQI